MSAGDVAASAAIVLVSLAAAVAGGWPVTAWVLRASTGREETGPDATQVLRGGTWIGVLERLAIAGTILVGYPQAIAVVIAIKGLGRFPELRASAGATAAERFIIGTLTSFCWAGAIGVGAKWALGALG